MRQCEEALRFANERRLAGAEFKRRIAEMSLVESRWELARVLEEPLPDEVGALRIEAFLRSGRRIGRSMAAKMLDSLGIKGHLRVREVGLGDRQRLAEALRRIGVRR